MAGLGVYNAILDTNKARELSEVCEEEGTLEKGGSCLQQCRRQNVLKGYLGPKTSPIWIVDSTIHYAFDRT